jgi:hypothetical protein
MKKVVLLGDSIRQGYDKYVKLAFEGEVQVYSPEENSRFAAYALRQLALWRKQMGCGSDVDLVHWNVGLWDCLILTDGLPLTPIEVYRDYLLRIHTVLKKMFPNAQQVFATSTKVQEHLFGVYKRRNCDIAAYNETAIQALAPLGVQIDDLNRVTADLPAECWSDSTHFNTRAGAQPLTEQVVACIEETLGVKGRSLDYDALFTKQTDIVGI